jgi:hypothetical protein
MNAAPIIARRTFTDGLTRDMFGDVEGQYAFGEDGQQVPGVWIAQ